MNLILHPYRAVLIQVLKRTKPSQMTSIFRWLDFAEVGSWSWFHWEIIFSVEGHFDLSSFPSTRNCHYFSKQNHQVIHEVTLHSENLIVLEILRRAVSFDLLSVEMKREKPLKSMATTTNPCYANLCTQKLSLYIENMWF